MQIRLQHKVLVAVVVVESPQLATLWFEDHSEEEARFLSRINCGIWKLNLAISCERFEILGFVYLIGLMFDNHLVSIEIKIEQTEHLRLILVAKETMELEYLMIVLFMLILSKVRTVEVK